MVNSIEEMNRLKNYLSVAALILVLVGCSTTEPEGVKILGLVRNPISNELAFVEKLNGSQVEIVDTLDVDGEGVFTSYVKVNEPSFLRINFYNRQYLNLILTGEEEEINLAVDGDRNDGISVVEGSQDTKLLEAIEAAEEKLRNDESTLNQQAIQARMNGDRHQEGVIRARYRKVNEENKKALKNQIRAAIPSLAALYGVNYLDVESNLPFIDSLLAQYSGSTSKHPFAVSLASRANEIRRLAVGALAPEIELPDPNGDMVSLSSLKGNYVLIDFWAAWCRPCRRENPNVVKLYEQYEGQNFEILGVSLDRTKEAWVKAIEQDGLSWKHVSDLSYFNSVAAQAYRIRSIPSTYLIGPDGKIIAKGLRGSSLRTKLAEIFG